MSKQNLNDSIDFKNLSDELTKTIAGAFAAGSKKGLSSANFMQDLTDQMEDFNKQQEASIFNERVKNLVLRTGLDTREVELRLMAKQAKMQAEQAGDLSSYLQIKQATEQRLAQMKVEEKREKIQKTELALADRIRGYDKERSEFYEKIEEKAHMFKDALNSGAARTALITAGAMKLGEAFSEAYKELKEEGLSVTQAAHESMTSFTDSISTGFVASNHEIMKARKAIMDTGGSLHDAEEAGAGAAVMAKLYGGSLENAGKAIGNLQKIPGLMKESAQSTVEFGAKLAQAANVPADTVTAALANNMDAAAKAGPNLTKSFAQAAVNAKKIGVEFSVVTGMADKLLDFESSINAQMEASVLLGKELNLDKAREAALAGDYAKVQQEILSQVGSEAEFTKMNVMQKQKLAEAMGVSVGDLAKMVKGQGELTDGTILEGEARENNNTIMAKAKNFLFENAGGVLAFAGSLAALIPQIMTRNSLVALNSTLTNINTGTQVVNTEATTSSTLAQKAASGATRMFGISAAGAVGPMLAFGGAVLMVGGGVALAAFGMAQLVKAFGETTNAGYALGAVGVVMAGFVGILYAMTAVLPLLGGAAAATAGPLLAFGAAVLMIGVGIGVAAAGIGYMVKSFGEIPYKNLQALPLAMMGIGAGLMMMAVAGLEAVPIIGMLIALGAVAPMLASLGNLSLGGKSVGKTKTDETDPLMVKLEAIANGLEKLVTNLSQPGVVNMDSKKVGDSLRLVGAYTTKFEK